MANLNLPPFSTPRHIQCAAARWITTFSPGNIADASVGDLIQGLTELQYFLEGHTRDIWRFQPLLVRLKNELPTAHAVLTQPLETYYQALNEITALLQQLCTSALDTALTARSTPQPIPCTTAHGTSTFSSENIADISAGDLVQGLTKLLHFVECHITETWGFQPLLDSLKAELPITNRVLAPLFEPYCQAIVKIKALLKQLRANA